MVRKVVKKTHEKNFLNERDRGKINEHDITS